MIKANNKSITQIYAGDKNCFIASKGNNVIFENDCNAFDITIKDGKTIDDLYRCVYMPIEENPYRWRKDKWFFQKLSGNNNYRIFSPPGSSLFAVLMLVDCIKSISVYKCSTNRTTIGDQTPGEIFSGIFAFSGIEHLTLNSISLESMISLNGMATYCSSLVSAIFDVKNADSIKDFQSIFSCCKNLESFSFRGFSNCENVYASGMFNDCSKLKEIDLTFLSSIKSHSNMVTGCTSLETLRLPIMSRPSAMSLRGCFSLVNISATLNGNEYNNPFKLRDAPLSRESAMLFIDYAARNPAPAGLANARIEFSKTTQKYLTADDIKIATDSGWTVEFLEPEPYTPEDITDLFNILKNAEVK